MPCARTPARTRRTEPGRAAGGLAVASQFWWAPACPASAHLLLEARMTATSVNDAGARPAPAPGIAAQIPGALPCDLCPASRPRSRLRPRPATGPRAGMQSGLVGTGPRQSPQGTPGGCRARHPGVQILQQPTGQLCLFRPVQRGGTPTARSASAMTAVHARCPRSWSISYQSAGPGLPPGQKPERESSVTHKSLFLDY